MSDTHFSARLVTALAVALLVAGCAKTRATAAPSAIPAPLQVSFAGEGNSTSKAVHLPARGLWNWTLSTDPACIVTAALIGAGTTKLGYSRGAESGGLFNQPEGTYAVEVTGAHRTTPRARRSRAPKPAAGRSG